MLFFIENSIKIMREKMMSKMQLIKVFILITFNQLFCYIYVSSSDSDECKNISIVRYIRDELYEHLTNQKQILFAASIHGYAKKLYIKQKKIRSARSFKHYNITNTKTLLYTSFFYILKF